MFSGWPTDLQGVSVLEAVSDHLSLGMMIQPVQLTATVSVVIEAGEPLETPLKLQHKQVKYKLHRNQSKLLMHSFQHYPLVVCHVQHTLWITYLTLQYTRDTALLNYPLHTQKASFWYVWLKLLSYKAEGTNHVMLIWFKCNIFYPINSYHSTPQRMFDFSTSINLLYAYVSQWYLPVFMFSW